MSMMRARLVFAMIGCAGVASAGCAARWSSPIANSPAGAAAVRATDPDHPALQPESQPDLASVLDKLQQVREIDPAAEPKLLDELRRTPADSWPLVAEQFRASLAYREQLAAKNRPMQRKPGGPREQFDSRPSAPIGALVDPRGADRDGVSSEALAQATPYSVPAIFAQAAAPGELSDDAPAYPIAAQAAPTGGGTSAVMQASLNSAYSPADQVAAANLQSSDDTSAAADLDWQQHVERAADDLSRRAAEAPTTTAEVHQHVSLRILRLLAGDTPAALEPIPHLPPVEQDYWSRQLFALATYLDHHNQPDDKRRAAASVTHLDEAVSHLRELGSLSLRNLSFCKEVHGYGAIEPYQGDRFSPGQQVSLYVEVENYHSASTERGFRTLLGSTYELLGEDGERAAGGEFPDVEDYCRSRRRDFHIQYGLALPQKLAPGHYRLELVVKDRQSDKLGHATAAFEIRGGGQ